MNTPNTNLGARPVRRRRPHPARRARKIAGTISVVTMLVLTAGLAAVSHPKPSTTTAATSTAASPAQTSYALRGSFSAAAVPANVSALAVTSTHAS